MKLSKLIKDIDVVDKYNYIEMDIYSLSHNSKDSNKDGIFFVINGYTTTGKNHVVEAIENGAKVLILEEYILDIDIPQIIVKNVRQSMSIIASTYYDNPKDNLKIISVIGTAGKTTTSMMIANILIQNDKRCGVIGTNGIYINGVKHPNNFTTPDPIELHNVFREMLDQGVEYVVMEVSVQAIYLDKMYGVRSIIGVFTNISNEHLDFFKTMENYASIKCDYFDSKNMDKCVVNIDDSYGEIMSTDVDIECTTISVSKDSDYKVINIGYSELMTTFDVLIDGKYKKVQTHFVGLYNVYNVLESMIVCKMLGIDIGNIIEAISNIHSIEGRFNVYEYHDTHIVIDFAHTPDSIEKVLETISDTFKKDIVTIFGAVGYSDREKRRLMGSSVSKYSKKIIITSDNSGNTRFVDIAYDLLKGIDRVTMLIEDRETAIRYAVAKLTKNEVLVILGKGHEDFQKIGDEKIKYSDKDIVESIL